MTKAAKPVSDDESCSQAKHAAELLDSARRSAPKLVHSAAIFVYDMNLETAVREIERLKKIEQRAKLVKYQNLTPNRVHLPCDVAAYILEGDQLQGGNDK